tara:strand:- start:17 stop:175 length:159 start_codon:yes stop_codon:yes gene_type:complete
MKNFNIITKYPMISIAILGAIIYLTGRILFSLFIAAIIMLPLYLAVQITKNK